MPLGNAIPPELMQLLSGQAGAAPQPAGADPRAAMLEALQNAMGQRSRMMPSQGSPATDSGIGDYLGEAVQTMTPKGQQPNYNNTGADPYVKYPPGGVPEPYRQDGGDLIPNRATSYNQQPGEDQAAAMAAKAVEGGGTTYPKGKGGDGEVNPQTEEIDRRQIKNILSVWDESDKTFEAETDMTREEAQGLLDQYGVKPPPR